MSKKLALAVGLAFAISATSASAETMAIKTSDLDLSRESDVKKLDQRIMSAARKICGASEHATGSRMVAKATADCVKQTAAEAREKLAAIKAQAKG